MAELVPMYESPDLGSVIEIDQSIPARHEWGGCCDMHIRSGRLLRDLYVDRDAIDPVATIGDVVEIRMGTAGYSTVLAFYRRDEKLLATDCRCLKNHLRESREDYRKFARSIMSRR